MFHKQLLVKPTRFINAEPGVLPLPSSEHPVPVVLLSFGGEDGPIEDRAFALQEARQMVVDILESLATLGDPMAQAIGEQYFSKQDGEDFELDGNEENYECDF